MAILWGVPPPAKLLRASINLLCVKASQEAVVCVLGPLVGVQTHWVGNRSIPCQGALECRVHEKPIEWKGFVPVVCHQWQLNGQTRNNAQWVLVVSAELGIDASAWLRGQIYRVMRPGRQSNGPMLAARVDQVWASPLPESFNVIPYVLRAAGLPALARTVQQRVG